MTDKYQCKECHGDYTCICLSCVRATEEKHDAMLKFIKKIARLDLTDNDIYARLEASYTGYEVSLDARKLLKETGEWHERVDK